MTPSPDKTWQFSHSPHPELPSPHVSPTPNCDPSWQGSFPDTGIPPYACRCRGDPFPKSPSVAPADHKRQLYREDPVPTKWFVGFVSRFNGVGPTKGQTSKTWIWTPAVWLCHSVHPTESSKAGMWGVVYGTLNIQDPLPLFKKE